MYPKLLKNITLAIFPILIASCTSLNSRKEYNFNSQNKSDLLVTETIEVTIVCNKSSIDSYINKGWKIQTSNASEIPCTWKTKKLTPKCNIKKDKGCAITVPDILGTKVTYTLIKTRSKDNQEKN